MRAFVGVSLGLSLFVGVSFLERSAWACGGTFCDQAPPGQPPMPVDQTGENVLFVMSGGYVEAHIQIQYQGDPQRFAWIVPVPKTPELSVGSQVLFTNLLNGTVPTFSVTTSFAACNGGTSTQGGSVGCGASSADSSEGAYAPSNDNPGTKSDAPTVVGRKTVGNFTTLTLSPTSAKGMLDWLVQNGYDADQADAEPILKDYIDRGYVFVALKLEADAGVDEIHPIVLRYPGDEPCVPLKLTRIAAVEDMTVRTFFLGSERVVPTGGYKHVSLNSARLDFTQLGQNYDLAVARAVDSPSANGRAFLTEYAGPSSVVNSTGIWQPSWKGETLKTLPALQVVPLLTGWGLVSCSSAASCQASHPLIFPLLDKYLPPPAGVQAAAYYSCMSCYPEADLSGFDAVAFAQDFDELVALPAAHAVEVLGDNVYLTRMLTRISPSEMTEDPMFREAGTPLPDVSTALSANRQTTCEGDVFTTTYDGRRVAGVTAPAGLPADMPWASVVEEFTLSGEHLVLVDNDESIEKQLTAYNRKVAPGSEPTAAEASGLGDETNGACGCVLPARRASHGIGIGVLGALGLVRRLTRRRSRK